MPASRQNQKDFAEGILEAEKEGMSVFGGESWAREAQYRKRRVDDVLVEQLDGSSYKKLSNGKYACLVCPHNPVLDSSLMLSMHFKGSRHKAAQSRSQERELLRKDEISKRLALSDSPAVASGPSSSSERVRVSKPLIEQAWKVASDVLCKESLRQNSENQNRSVKLKEHISDKTTLPRENNSHPSTMASVESIAQWQKHLREHRERELKFIEAGWRRDGHGQWYKDENVEFDSDEEDPNVTLSWRTNAE